MLVLSRKAEESFLIGDDVVVSVVRVQGNKVRIGIQAPESVPVIRSELLAEDYVLAKVGSGPEDQVNGSRTKSTRVRPR